MAIPEQELKNFNFSAGMNTELGLVNTDEKTLKNLENVELLTDGSAERRPGLSLFESDLIDSEPMDITSQRSSTGWVYPAPSIFFWETIKNNKPTDVMVVGNIGKDVSSKPTINMKELPNGISDIESWSTDKGTELVNTISVQFLLEYGFPAMIDQSAVSKLRFTNGGSFLIVTNENNTPSVISGPSSTETGTFYIYTKNELVHTTDSIVQSFGAAYICIASHTASSSTRPGVGTVWQHFWISTGRALGPEPVWVVSTTYTSNKSILWFNLFGNNYGEGEKRMTHAAFVGGRAWYTGVPETPATVYVTQPVTTQTLDLNSAAELGYCFSVNDPNSITDSSPSAADGGTITIREAGIIHSMAEFREGLIIFASNGTWSIPNAGNFNATNFNVLKISSVPISGPDSFVNTDFGVMYFGENSVQLIGITDNGNMVAQEISLPIRTFYNSISNFSKETSFATYDSHNQRVYWFTTFNEPTFISGDHYRTLSQNKEASATQDILIFDFKLKAWYKYQIRKDQVLADTDLMIAHADTFVGDFGEEPTVVNLAGDTVINAAGDTVVSSSFDGNNIQEFMIMLVTGKKTISVGADVFRYGFAHLQGDLTQDFDNLPTADDDLKSTFDSEILTQHMNFTDIGHNKQSPYIHTIFRRVETGIIDAGGNDITPGGCKLQLRWNWSSGVKAGPQFGTAFQAYRPFRWNINPGDGSLPDIEVVLNRHKVRGRGRALQLRFTNDGTKRFHLLGYQLEVEATKKV